MSVDCYICYRYTGKSARYIVAAYIPWLSAVYHFDTFTTLADAIKDRDKIEDALARGILIYPPGLAKRKNWPLWDENPITVEAYKIMLYGDAHG